MTILSLKLRFMSKFINEEALIFLCLFHPIEGYNAATSYCFAESESKNVNSLSKLLIFFIFGIQYFSSSFTPISIRSMPSHKLKTVTMNGASLKRSSNGFFQILRWQIYRKLSSKSKKNRKINIDDFLMWYRNKIDLIPMW